METEAQMQNEGAPPCRKQKRWHRRGDHGSRGSNQMAPGKIDRANGESSHTAAAPPASSPAPFHSVVGTASGFAMLAVFLILLIVVVNLTVLCVGIRIVLRLPQVWLTECDR